MPVPEQVIELVDRFERNREAYQSSQYNETQLRREFLDPFFETLGWDVNNKHGSAEAYKDVIHEDAIKVGGATKAPDYCFRFGATRKFFVEAKRPSVNIKEDADPAFQLRRYAWSAKLPLSILSDFEEFAVYDCRIKPAANDKPATGRIMYLECTDYLGRWDDIASIFSREAVRTGSFDKFAVAAKGKKGTADVDAAFLSEIESWRSELARNLALRNPRLEPRELNFAVQRIIDRIIFLRIAEDRGIEDYGRLMGLTNGERIFRRLCEQFERADERYNSGLFHFHKERDRAEPPDELTLGLALDDDLLAGIIRGLYYPESPYEFSVLPADILGQVYEQFLGKVIRLTPGHRAVVEDKPEVKKAGGVYYTPTYIVDYIVKHTVGELLEGSGIKASGGRQPTDQPANAGRSPDMRAGALNPAQAAKLRILDPACGSGSFLIGAFQFLLDWHLKWYTEHDPDQWLRAKKAPIYEVQSVRSDRIRSVVEPDKSGHYERTLRLTTAERKRILLANIYGVDIDPQAVETTKLSLLLKVLEGESHESLERQRRLFHERALPDLGHNIKCGNSLIGPDFYDQQQMSLLDDEERYRINVFDWQAEFPAIMKGGGFDAVIGNPPYLPIFELDKNLLKAFAKSYRFYGKRYDSYALFLERAIGLLMKEHAKLGFIIPSSILNNEAFRGLRGCLIQQTRLVELAILGGKVFLGVNKDTMTILLGKGFNEGDTAPVSVRFFNATPIEWGDPKKSLTIPQRQLMTDGQFMVVEPVSSRLLEKVGNSPDRVPLGSLAKSFQGIVTGADEVFVVPNGEATSFNQRERHFLRPFLFGSDIDRFAPVNAPQKILYVTRHDSLDDARNIRERLQKAKSKLLKRRETRQGKTPWFALHWARDKAIFEQPKILVQGIRNLTLPRRVVATIDVSDAYAGVNLTIINGLPESPYDLRFLLGTLNSSLINFFVRARYIDHRIKQVYLDAIPIHRIVFSNPADEARHERMVELVECMLALHQQLASAKTDHAKTSLERQIEATDRQIDRLVYELYGLTDEEIAIVEEATGS